MKILYIITGLRSSGAELMLYKLCSSIVQKKYDISVISLTSFGDLGDEFEKIGISVIPLGLNKNLFFNIPKLYSLYILIKRYSPDLVHTWMYHADLIGGLISKLAGVRCIIWCIRNSNLSFTCTKFSTRVVLWICSKLSSFIPTKIVCCSRKAINIHSNYGYKKDKFYYIPNGFDLSKFKPSTSYHSKLKVELNISSSKRLIGMIGRFDPQKNHLRFLECVHLLNKKFDDLAFIFVGNRIDHSNLELKKVIDKYNLSKSIYLLGKRNDIEFIMPALDILVLPSIYGEAFPNVIGEAMSCGVPCVVTDVGDSSSIVGSTGFVVSPNDNESLFRSISHMLNLSRDDYNQLSNDARKRIATHYDISVISKQYINLYNRYFL